MPHMMVVHFVVVVVKLLATLGLRRVLCPWSQIGKGSSGGDGMRL